MKILTKKSNGWVEASFKDTGTDIKTEHKKKNFTLFFTRKAQGMGVGLAIYKRFVECHNGIIEMKSEECKGSCFTVKLPINGKGGGIT